MAIIGLVGYKGSGKTTACNIIKKHLDDVVQINFKDALVQELKDNFPDLLKEIQYSEWYKICAHSDDWDTPVITVDDLFELKPPLVRTLMQNYGTDVRRKEDADYWVSKWWSKVTVTATTGVIAETTHRNINTLTDDVRFHNEAEAIKDLGGILIRLERRDLEATDQHESETQQREIECDYTITVGKGEFDKLEEELLKIIK